MPRLIPDLLELIQKYLNPYAVLYFALEGKDLDFFLRVTEVFFFLL